MYIPTREEFLSGCRAYELHEKRDSMYKVAYFVIEHLWGSPADMTDGLTVLLLSWNRAFYRTDNFDADALEKCLAKHFQLLDHLRNRNISSFNEAEGETIRALFNDILSATQINEGPRMGYQSPVSVAKTLHLLCPNFFPIWDSTIARKYDCNYSKDPVDAYLKFCHLMQEFAQIAEEWVRDNEKTLLKRIDEYNYAKYTKRWI